MSKRMKFLVAVLVAILLLTVGGTAMVMAEEPTPTPEPSNNGLLARVAEKLGVSQEELSNAFRQARQEMREEAFTGFLDKAVEEGRLTEEEADEIKEWWEQKPEVLGSNLFPRAFGPAAPRLQHMRGGHRGGHRPMPPRLAD